MSFVGRATVWSNLNNAGTTMGDHRSNRAPLRTQLTPLEIMTGSRLAAGYLTSGSWSNVELYDDTTVEHRVGPRLTDQLRRPYQQIFGALTRKADRAPESRVCPRCGQAPHNDWGQEYERLVCMEITSA